MLYIILTVLEVIAAFICLYIGFIKRRLIKSFKLYHGYTWAIYNNEKEQYEFKTDYGMPVKYKSQKIDNEIDMQIEEKQNEKLKKCYICYDRENLSVLYECDETDEILMVNHIKKKCRLIFIMAIIVLIVSAFAQTILQFFI